MSDGELTTPYWRLEDDGGQSASVRLRAVAGSVIRIVRQAAPVPALLILILQTASGAATAFGLLATTGALEDLLAAGVDRSAVVAAIPGLALVVAAFAARGALDTGVALALARLLPAVRRVAEERLFDASLRVELAAFDDPSFYDQLHRARDRGLMHLEQSAEDLVAVIGAVLGIVAAAGSVGILHPVLLPVLLLGVLPEGWAVLRAARLEYAGMNRTIALHRRLLMLMDLATKRESAAEIRACQAEPFVLDEYGRAADGMRDQLVSVGLSQARVRAIGRGLAGVGVGATFAVLGLLVYHGWVALAAAGTAVVAIRAATAALRQAVLAANHLFEQARYVGDYQSFLTDAADRTPRPRPRRSAGPGRIVVRGVTFHYPGGTTPALREVDVTIETGQTVALVGENGSGKTTLAKLIGGLYRPDVGTVTWDGVDLAGLDPRSVGDQVVMVLQEPVRWPHTARDNVRVGRHDRRDPAGLALRDAAVRARADEVVEGLPQGWDTLLSRYFRGGHELSGGQWQRIAVARGLYRDAPLLIWDEPTAPLDARAEYAVYEALRQMAGGRTTILITHRLASIRHAGRIYLLHEGRIAEQGSHADLIAAGGRYAELYQLQARMHGASTEPVG